jgi:hypothetical protein
VGPPCRRRRLALRAKRCPRQVTDDESRGVSEWPALHQIIDFTRFSSFERAKLAPKRATEVSVYFDTEKHKLRNNGVMLRVRRVGKRHIQTIKATGNLGPFERDEWEADIVGKNPDLSLARGTALEPLLNNKLRQQLKPLFENTGTTNGLSNYQQNARDCVDDRSGQDRYRYLLAAPM